MPTAGGERSGIGQEVDQVSPGVLLLTTERPLAKLKKCHGEGGSQALQKQSVGDRGLDTASPADAIV